MNKNSTLKLWLYLLEENYTSFDKEAKEIFSNKQIEPKRRTLDTILAYSRSVQGIDVGLKKERILISLN